MKTKQKRHPNSDADHKLRQAGERFLDIASETLSTGEMDAFAEWVDADDTHREKLNLMASVWTAMDALKDEPLVSRTVEKSLARERASNRGGWLDRLIPNFAGFRYAAAAAAIILMIGGFWLARDRSLPPETYKTAVGEQKTVYLSDGSTIYIDTNSAVSARFSEGARNIELLEGRAYFSVAHDSTRPFIVMAGRIAARALGTGFEVYKRREGKVTVAVSTGQVQVNRITENNLSKVRKGLPLPAVEPADGRKLPVLPSGAAILSGHVLAAGQEIVVDESVAEYLLTSSDPDNVAAWREGRLNFQSKALPEVIEELNRYLTDKIIIGDSVLKDLNVSVYFKIKNRKDFIATLENAFPITSRTLANGQVILFSRQ